MAEKKIRQRSGLRPSGYLKSSFNCFYYLCLALPTVLIIKGYRLFFFSNEGSEPIHIHIEKAQCYAKFWIDPLCVVLNYGFTGKELREIGDIIEDNELLIRGKWDEYFSR